MFNFPITIPFIFSSNKDSLNLKGLCLEYRTGFNESDSFEVSSPLRRIIESESILEWVRKWFIVSSHLSIHERNLGEPRILNKRHSFIRKSSKQKPVNSMKLNQSPLKVSAGIESYGQGFFSRRVFRIYPGSLYSIQHSLIITTEGEIASDVKS